MGSEPTLYEDDVDVDGWVAQLQSELAAAGFDPGPIDGWFGPRTKAAVESFQAANGCEVDGVFGNESWSILRGRDREPPGVNNGPHGDTRPHHGGGGGGGGGGTAGHQGGIGWSYGQLDLKFTSDPYLDEVSGNVVVDLDVQGTMNEDVHIAAHISGAGVDHQSEWVTVNSNGPQSIPLGISPIAGFYDLTVYATGQGGNATDSRSAAIAVGGGTP